MLLTGTLLLLLLSLQVSRVAARFDDDDDDDEGIRITPGASTCNCNDAECSIVEKLKVGSLCADDLCVGGAPVIPGNVDPCKSTGLDSQGRVVSVSIRDCCSNSTDCARFQPHPCYHSQCIRETGSEFGSCLHQALPAGQCCAQSTDCPVLACQTVECVNVTSPATASVRVKRSDGNFHKIFANEAVLSLTGVCNYTARSNVTCCVSSSDCNCPVDTEPVCELPGVCKCLSTCRNECGVDSDCPTLDEDHPHWAANPCITNRCIMGFCRPVKDENADKDRDGIKCKLDCDDNDPNNGTALFCTVENATTVDVDGDGIARCGAEVNRTCAGRCAAGKVEVPFADLSRAIFFDNNFVDKNCDCCDRNASGIDVKIFCGVNNDSDSLFDPILKLAPNGLAVNASNCLEQFCVVLGPLESAAERDDLASAECRLELGNANADSFDINALPASRRLLRRSGAHAAAGVLPRAGVGDGQRRHVAALGVQRHAEQRHRRRRQRLLRGVARAQHAQHQRRRHRSAAALRRLLQDAAQRLHQLQLQHGVRGGQPGHVPARARHMSTCNQTSRGDLHSCNGFDAAITCVRDNDRDCYYDCANPVDLCVDFPRTITGQMREKCNIEKSVQPSALTEEQLCCISGIEKGAPYRALSGAQGAPGDNDFCDCNDEDKTAFQLITCFRDADHDSFPACFSNGTIQCSLQCAATCDVAGDGGFTSGSAITCGPRAGPPSPTPPGPPPGPPGAPTPPTSAPGPTPTLAAGKRSLDAVKEVVEAHAWFNKRSVLLPAKSKCPNKDCAAKVPRADGTCRTTTGVTPCTSSSQS